MKKCSDQILLLTACINPGGMSFTAINNAELRKKQYIDALTFYLQKTDFSIVFVENTNTDLSDCFKADIDSGRLEILTFDGNKFPSYLGKGYGEALIIKHAFTYSGILQNNKGKSVVKISGRHVVVNINAIVSLVRKLTGANGYVCSDFNTKTQGSISDMFLATTDFYQNYFLPSIDFINDSKGVWFEHILYQAMKKYSIDGKDVLFLPLPLKQLGQSGSTGEDFVAPSFFYYLRNCIKSLLYKYRILRVV